jgi:hypothetical protein
LKRKGGQLTNPYQLSFIEIHALVIYFSETMWPFSSS